MENTIDVGAEMEMEIQISTRLFAGKTKNMPWMNQAKHGP